MFARSFLVGERCVDINEVKACLTSVKPLLQSFGDHTERTVVQRVHPFCFALHKSIAPPEATKATLPYRPRKRTRLEDARYLFMDARLLALPCSEPPAAGLSAVRNLWKTVKITAQLVA
jgi:hypothetical protein